jgi:hypothetical protein
MRTRDPGAYLIVEALFGHLSIRAAGSRAMATFDVVRDVRDGWTLSRNGDRLGGCETLAGLAPLLHAEISMSAYEHTDRLAGLHAAVVVRGDHAVLMPAESGSGKSTLTAALAADGCDSCSDDLAILTRRPIKLRPASVCIGLKSGSLQPLMSRLPALSKLPVHARADGRGVRYLPPPAERLVSNSEAYAVGTIVFPRYEKGTRLSCRRVSPGEGLVRLARAGYDADLNADVVSALLEWLKEVEIYSLKYGDLDQAVTAVGRWLR